MSLWQKFLLGLCIFFGIFLRIYPGIYESIFPYDQARDALVVREMVLHKNLKLLGPVSDIPGVHHGPLFYYIIAPLYALSKWDPWLPLLFFVFLNICAVSGVYALSRSLFSHQVAFISSILFLFSYEIVSYAKWLSNPVLVIPLFPWFLYFLWNQQRLVRNIFIAGILFGLIIQSELVMGFLLFFVYSFFAIKKSNIRDWIIFHGGAILGVLPLLLAEVKFRGQVIRGLIGYVLSRVQHTKPPVQTETTFPLVKYGEMMVTLFQKNVWGFPTLFAGLFLICIICGAVWYSKRTSNLSQVFFLLGPLLWSVVLFFTGRPPEKFFFIGMGILMMILFTYVLTTYTKNMRSVIATIIIFLAIGSQLRMIYVQARDNHAYVQVQDGVLLRQRKQVLDAVYAQVPQNTPFTVSIFETPYGIRSAWSYYFSWYKSKRDVVIPQWYGFAADGYIGDEILPRSDGPFQTHITIYEPNFDIGPEFTKNFREYQDNHTILVKEFVMNNHRIQVRKPKDTEE
ncbi:MAG: glycosyltransferase family 39 protein [Candidatus Pacebacteria bacterium]|nr:glycosyltransferase family 39 protein [Candidatus Paceibacterota bacterium]